MKRTDFYHPDHEAKRPKLQLNTNNTDDIWGDDPEIEEFDKCLNLATQICEDQGKHDFIDNTISYEEFKTKKVCSSTQMIMKNSHIASFSNVTKSRQNCNDEISVFKNDVSLEHLMKEIAELKAKNKELEDSQRTSTGEVTILRAQLAQAQKDIEKERLDKIRSIEATNQKWNMKFINATKDSESCKNTSDLKDLEIANLKEKVSELKRSHNLTLNATQEFLNNDLKRKVNGSIIESKTSSSVQTKNTSLPFISFESIYPLEELIPESYFDQCKIDNANNFGKLRRMKGGKCCENCLHTEIIFLRKSTRDQLNSVKTAVYVNKILFVVRKSLLSLYKTLKTRFTTNKEDLETKENNEDDIRNDDCLFSKLKWHNHEIYVDLRRSLAVCSNLLLFSKVVFEYFSGTFKKSLEYNFLEGSDKEMPIYESDFKLLNSEEFDFLNILLNIFTIIEKNKASKELSGFIAAVLKLLSNLGKKQINEECCIIINVIFKIIISSKFDHTLIGYICSFLKSLSSYPIFLLNLCKICHTDLNKKLFKEEISKKDVCSLQNLTKQLHNCKRDVTCNYDIIQFLVNTISCNEFWEYNSDSERCTCLAEIYSIVCNILYDSLDDYLTNITTITDKELVQNYKRIFRLGIIFLDILVVRHPDLIGRYSRLYYQYQAILKKLNILRETLHLKVFHQTALDQLLSQLYIDIQNIEDTNDELTNTVFEETFTTF